VQFKKAKGYWIIATYGWLSIINRVTYRGPLAVDLIAIWG